MGGQRQQARLFFGKDLLDGAGVVSGPAALMRYLITPDERLPVTLGERSEGTARPEGFAYIANRALHAAFLIAGPDLARARDEVIMRAQFQQARVEMDLVGAPLNNGRFEIVIQNYARLT